MELTARLAFPYLAASQSQKHVTVNESLRKLDALVQIAVVSRATIAQPGSPADGALYILPAGKSGAAWGAMADGAVAYYVDGAWSQLSPRKGWLAWVEDEGRYVAFVGSPVYWKSPPGLPETLAANRTYYINSSTGSDSNNGLSSGAAFATIQKAVNAAASLNLGGFIVTISCAAGTYNEAVLAKPLVGGSIDIVGDVSTPTNCQWVGAGYCFHHNTIGNYTLRGFDFTSTEHGIFTISKAADVTIKNAVFGAILDTALYAVAGKISLFGTSVTIDGSSTYFARATIQGLLDARAVAFTLTGTPNWSAAFAEASELGWAGFNASTFSGSGTGKRYNATLNGVIVTNGGGASFLPGNSAGTTATGGQYA